MSFENFDKETKEGHLLLQVVQLGVLTKERFEELDKQLKDKSIEDVLPTVKSLHDEQIYYFIARSSDVDSILIGPKKLSLLRLAIDTEDTMFAANLLDLGADADAFHDEHNETFLNLALLRGDTLLAKVLIASGAQINVRCSSGVHSFVEAIRLDDAQLLDMYLNYPYKAVEEVEQNGQVTSTNVFEHMGLGEADYTNMRERLYQCSAETLRTLHAAGVSIGGISDVSHPVIDHWLLVSTAPADDGVLPLTVDTRTIPNGGDLTQGSYESRGGRFLWDVRSAAAQASGDKDKLESKEKAKEPLGEELTRIQYDLYAEYLQELCVALGVGPNDADVHGRTLLMGLARHAGVMEVVLGKHKDANVHVADNEGRSLLSYTCCTDASQPAFGHLLRHSNCSPHDIMYAVLSSDAGVEVLGTFTTQMLTSFAQSHLQFLRERAEPPAPEVEHEEALRGALRTLGALMNTPADLANPNRKFRGGKAVLVAEVGGRECVLGDLDAAALRAIEGATLRLLPAGLTPFAWACGSWSSPGMVGELMDMGCDPLVVDACGHNSVEKLVGYLPTDMDERVSHELVLEAVMAGLVKQGRLGGVSVSVVDVLGTEVVDAVYEQECQQRAEAAMKAACEAEKITPTGPVLQLRVCKHLRPPVSYVSQLSTRAIDEMSVMHTFPYRHLHRLWLDCHRHLDKHLLLTAPNEYKYAVERSLARRVYAFAHGVSVADVPEHAQPLPADAPADAVCMSMDDAMQTYRAVIGEHVREQWARIDQGVEALVLSLRALRGDEAALAAIQQSNSAFNTERIGELASPSFERPAEGVTDLGGKRAFSTYVRPVPPAWAGRARLSGAPVPARMGLWTGVASYTGASLNGARSVSRLALWALRAAK